MRKLCICLLALVLAVAPMTALAAKLVQPGSDFYYLDEANVLSQETEGEIFFCNQILEKKCGAQIVVAALNDIGGADIFNYATDLAEEWGIGDKSEKNGLLLLMTIDDENYYVTVGSGIRGIFPASTLKQMFDKYLEPDFAAKRYDAGAKKFFEAVFERVAEYYNLTVTPAEGVAAYESYMASNAGASGFGGARGGGARGGWDEGYDDYGYYGDEPEGGSGLLGLIVAIVVLLLVMRMMSRVMVGRGSTFWLWHLPFFYMPPMRGPWGYRRYDGPPPGPGPRRRPPPGGFGGGGFGGFGGGGGRSGGGFGGFGGARGGGGGGFGGGAGRGRH